MVKQNYRIRFSSGTTSNASTYIQHAAPFTYTSKQKDQMLRDMNKSINIWRNDPRFSNWKQYLQTASDEELRDLSQAIISGIHNSKVLYFDRYRIINGWQDFDSESYKDMFVDQLENRGYENVRDLVYNVDAFIRKRKRDSDMWREGYGGHRHTQKKQAGGR